MPRVRVISLPGQRAWDGCRPQLWFVLVGRYRGRRFRLPCGEGEQGRRRAVMAAAELAAGGGRRRH
jgi:hypothetical protein